MPICYELFAWIKSDKTDFFTPNQMVALSDIAEASQRAQQSRRELLAHAHASRWQPSAQNTTEDAICRLTYNDAYTHFIEFCRDNLNRYGDSSSLWLTLQFLLLVEDAASNIPHIDEKITSVFFALWDENSEKAFKFYQENTSLFSRLKLINAKVASAASTSAASTSAASTSAASIKTTTEYLAELTEQLTYQEDPFSIAPLFKQFVDNTEQFAAVILWLLQREVSVEHILQTRLLQHFILYHSAWIEAEDSPVRHFYQLLEQFPATKDLIQAAHNVRFEERGFHCENEGARSYAITGVLAEQRTWHVVEEEIPTVAFSPTKNNFVALHALLGQDFLPEALTFAARSANANWHEALHETLNQEALGATELTAFINRVALNEASPKLGLLASLIDDATIEKLIAARSGALLHLLPYKPYLLARIGQEALVTDFLLRMREEDERPFDIIPQLLALLKAFRKVNKPIAALVYETLLDIILKHPLYMDNDYLAKQLIKFSEKKPIIERRYAELQAEFERSVTDSITPAVFNTAGFHAIEDAWTSLTPKWICLGEILPITSPYPVDKYQLQACVAKRYFLTHSHSFDLDNFFRTLQIVPELSPAEVTEYERGLIEILATIDDHAIREAIIEKLDSHRSKKNYWMNRPYGKDCIFEKAVQQGNLGLIEWLVRKTPMSAKELKQTITLAAETNQWLVVMYFCQRSSHLMKPHDLKDLLNKATAAGQLPVVLFLCDNAIKHLEEKTVFEAFKRAVEAGHCSIIQYYCDVTSRAPNPNVRNKLLKLAIQLQRLDIIDCIGNSMEDALLASTIMKALTKETKGNGLLVVQHLCGLQKNVPHKKARENVFLEAVQNGHLHLVQFFCKLPLSTPVMDMALHEAFKDKHWDIVHHLCSINGPSQVAVERILPQAVTHKRADIVQRLCSMGAKAPRQQVTEMAIQLAANTGQLAMVRCLCKLNPPRLRAILSAYEGAATNHHADVENYCRDLILILSSNRRRISLPLPITPHLDSTEDIKRSSSMSNASKLGLFGSRRVREDFCQGPLPLMRELSA